jgi:hypothetical protein
MLVSIKGLTAILDDIHHRIPVVGVCAGDSKILQLSLQHETEGSQNIAAIIGQSKSGVSTSFKIKGADKEPTIISITNVMPRRLW